MQRKESEDLERATREEQAIKKEMSVHDEECDDDDNEEDKKTYEKWAENEEQMHRIDEHERGWWWMQKQNVSKKWSNVSMRNEKCEMQW